MRTLDLCGSQKVGFENQPDNVLGSVPTSHNRPTLERFPHCCVVIRIWFIHHWVISLDIYSLTPMEVNKIQRTGISTEPWFSNFKKIGFLTTIDSLPVHHENHGFFDVLEIPGTNHFSNFHIFSLQKKWIRQSSGSENF